MANITISAEELTNALDGRIHIMSFEWMSGSKHPSFEIEIREDVEFEDVDVVSEAEHEQLQDIYEHLQLQYEDLETKYNDLKEEFDAMKEQFNTTEFNYKTLSTNYDELWTTKCAIESELRETKMSIWKRWFKK